MQMRKVSKWSSRYGEVIHLINQGRTDWWRMSSEILGSEASRKEVQSLREYVRRLGKLVGKGSHSLTQENVLVYDIETSRVEATVWSTGKQYVSHAQLRSETRIISIAWKYIDEDEVHCLTWDKKTRCDKQLVKEFLKVYNSVKFVVGQNNNSFDNKLISARAAKHGLHVDRFIKSFDIYRMAKRAFRLPSYSMKFMAKYFGLTNKMEHSGISLWDAIEYGKGEAYDTAMKEMILYNKVDVIVTEELFLKLRPYFGTVTNEAAENDSPKWACPVSGSDDVKLLKTVFTEAGTVQRIMYCNKSKHQYKVSNRAYSDFLKVN